MARDPILFAGLQANLYVYVGNDPVNLVDPSGYFGVPGALIGAGVGATTGFLGTIAADGSFEDALFAASVGFAGGFIGGSLELGVGASAGMAAGAAAATGLGTRENFRGVLGAAVGAGLGGAVGGLPGLGMIGIAIGGFLGGVGGTAFGLAGRGIQNELGDSLCGNQ